MTTININNADAVYFGSRKVDRIYKGAEQVWPWTPAVLFANGEQGAWYDPSDLSTLFQDAEGTVPVTAPGQPVGLMLDKSGNGNHVSQTTTAARPLYQVEPDGLAGLAFDGVDDYLQTASEFRTLSPEMWVRGRFNIGSGWRFLMDGRRTPPSPPGTAYLATVGSASGGASFPDGTENILSESYWGGQVITTGWRLTSTSNFNFMGSRAGVEVVLGAVYGLCLVDSVLTETNRQELVAFLSSKSKVPA